MAMDSVVKKKWIMYVLTVKVFLYRPRLAVTSPGFLDSQAESTQEP